MAVLNSYAFAQMHRNVTGMPDSRWMAFHKPCRLRKELQPGQPRPRRYRGGGTGWLFFVVNVEIMSIHLWCSQDDAWTILEV